MEDTPENESRRRLLGSAVSASTVVLIPLSTTSCTTAAPDSAFSSAFPENTQNTLNAFVSRIIPVDENGPGALEAGVPDYINRALQEWRQNEIPELRQALNEINLVAQNRHQKAFHELQFEQQDALMEAMEEGELQEVTNGSASFSRLRRLAVEGMFSDPFYGGNKSYAGWDLIAYPGIVMNSTPGLQRMGGRLPPLHTSAYGEAHDGD